MCECGASKDDLRLVGRLPVDLQSASNQVQIPATSRGLSITWIPDNAGNLAGSVTVYYGDASGVPWSFMKAPAAVQAISCGPLDLVTQRGAYLTLVIAANSKGLLLFEFHNETIKRKYSST